MLTTRPRPAIVIHCFCALIVAITLFGCPASSTNAQDSTRNSDVSIALEGLDPVMLSQGKEVSPIVINVDGQDQLVAFMYGEVVGVDPSNGNLLWSHPHPVEYGLNTSTPVWGPDNLLFVSSGYNGGSRVIKLSRAGDKTTVEELWAHGLMRIHFTNAIRVGDFVYGSSGDFGPAPFTAINVKTGKVLWRNRSFPRASFLLADGRFVILDEDGHLLLATATPEGLTVTSKVELLSSHSWTVPSLAGTRLYVRDRKNIMALELGAQ